MNAPETTIRFRDLGHLSAIYAALYEVGYRHTGRDGETVADGVRKLHQACVEREGYDMRPYRYLVTWDWEVALMTDQDKGRVLVNSIPHLVSYVRRHGFPRGGVIEYARQQAQPLDAP